MSLLRRYRWFGVAAGITLAFAVVCFVGRPGFALTAFADLAGLIVMLAGLGVVLWNARTRPPQERSFWIMLALGFSFWCANQTAWSYQEILIRKPIPDPYFFDIILFFHSLPMIAAVGWRPDLLKKSSKLYFSVLNFLMLAGWWVFLYAFIVFPHQYVVPNFTLYNDYYDQLYGLENILLLVVLALATFTSSRAWKRLYLNFLVVSIIYAINSQLLDRAAANSTYYSGSPYDIALIATIAWMAATALSARDWKLQSEEFQLHLQWKKLVPQLAMFAMLSLPVLGLWTVLYDDSAAPTREFRVFAVLIAMLFLGTCVFLRQYLQDQTLIGLLQESRQGYSSQKRLQSQLVQKEKLASLGTLVAGAAHEINHPLAAIMAQSEELWAKEGLTDQQHTLLRKIVNQARRTRDLVTDLLSFAQQAPGEKQPIDLALLLSRATQLLEAQRPGANIRVTMSLQPDLPRVLGNANQLFQALVEIVDNAMDALEDAGGGSLEISASRFGSEVMLQFSDSGAGLREPERVFDPFYTTKPVGKGTGLGLSAVYGVVQEHHGQITCQNKPEGGALFIVKFPVATQQVAAQVAGANA